MLDERLIAAAKRLRGNPDFHEVIGYLTAEQGRIILSMDALSEHLVHAKIYYDALEGLPANVDNLTKEPTDG